MEPDWASRSVLNPEERFALRNLRTIQNEDLGIAQGVLELPWFSDGIQGQSETTAVVALLELTVRGHSSLAQILLNIEWFRDDIHSQAESTAVVALLELTIHDQTWLVQLLLGLQWFKDGISVSQSPVDREDYILFELWQLAYTNPDKLELAVRLLGIENDNADIGPQREIIDLVRDTDASELNRLLELPWLADGVNIGERTAIPYLIHHLNLPSHVENWRNRDQVLDIMSFWTSIETLKEARLTGQALESLKRLSSERAEQLRHKSWVRDGLTDEEVALIAMLPYIPHDESTFRSVIEDGQVVSDTISLPLAGEVDLYVVSPFPLQEDVLNIMGAGIIAMEGFMGSPWNSPEVIAFIESEGRAGGGGGSHRGSHIVVKNSHPGTLYHELGHYYFRNMPTWMNEGGAEFLRAYVLEQIEEGAEYSLRYRRGIVSQVLENCAQKGAANIQEWVDAPSGPLWGCRYSLGEHYLQEMYRSLGHDVVAASLQQLYELRESGSRVTEDDIYDTFLSNTAEEKRDDFRDLYLCLHGRPIPGYASDPPETPTNVKSALSALYIATNGPGWKNNENWLSDDVPVGKWHGVVTNCDGDVVELQLGNNNLVGPIPQELANLSNLERLHLQSNELTGEIPPVLGNLSNLVWLFLDDNQFTGSIPSDLGNLSSLMLLTIEENNLTGPLPSELGGLPNLGWLYLSGNQLTGTIPPELGALQNLRALHLRFNQLSGPIPSELGNSSKLERLLLDGNLLTGAIPPELGSLSKLERLYLAGNMLTGCIPKELQSVERSDHAEPKLPFC